MPHVNNVADPSDGAIYLYRQLDEAATARLLGVSQRKLQLMRQRGDGPRFIRISARCIRYRIKDLIEYQEARLRQNTLGGDL